MCELKRASASPHRRLCRRRGSLRLRRWRPSRVQVRASRFVSRDHALPPHQAHAFSAGGPRPRLEISGTFVGAGLGGSRPSARRAGSQPLRRDSHCVRRGGCGGAVRVPGAACPAHCDRQCGEARRGARRGVGKGREAACESEKRKGGGGGGRRRGGPSRWRSGGRRGLAAMTKRVPHARQNVDEPRSQHKQEPRTPTKEKRDNNTTPTAPQSRHPPITATRVFCRRSRAKRKHCPGPGVRGEARVTGLRSQRMVNR